MSKKMFIIIYILLTEISIAHLNIVDYKMFKNNSWYRKGRVNMNNPVDPSSFSRPEYATVKHIHLALDVNFEKQVLEGHVELNVLIKDTTVEKLILDIDQLDVKQVQEMKLNEALSFKVGERLERFGSELSIQLPQKRSAEYLIHITYKTATTAAGLQWLTPVQTAGKNHPFLFSQFEAILARSVLPCQDTPAVKASYTAVITAPAALTVLMSAVNEGNKILPDGRKEYRFIQKVPIPSYLIAIVVGRLVSKAISGRCQVWAEEKFINAAHYEFANTEKQLRVAEELCGPYVWGRYDLILLPPSFPFGGMENPCLTFVTPTLLAGDRSMVNVIAHEISHSWTGNLVTNVNFEHFWLNEGFTVFIERRIISRLEGWEVQDFDATGGIFELKETIYELGTRHIVFTSLVTNLTNVDPGDFLSKIPYEKGSLFLRYLELVVGGPEYFEPFLKKYLEHFKNKSIASKDFKEFFEIYFTNFPNTKLIDWNSWLYDLGMPSIIPRYDTKLVTVVRKMLLNIESCFTLNKNDVKNFSATQRVMLLLNLREGEPMSVDKLLKLQDLLDLKDARNSEIKFRWYRLCVKAKWLDKVDEILTWIGEIGRLKYIGALYTDLYNFVQVREKTINNFKKYRSSMMLLCANIVAKILNLQ